MDSHASHACRAELEAQKKRINIDGDSGWNQLPE